MKAIHSVNYDIFINDIESLIEMIEDAQYDRILAIVDRHSEYLCLSRIMEHTDRPIHKIMVKEGELHKSLNTCEKIWDEMITQGATRHSLCLNVGGGVIGDMGGFAAATYMRGMSFIQVPTTLLAQVDASIGGKLGVDYQSYKNMIGVIKDPQAVFIFTEFLDSLPYRQILSGYAELLKHGLIRDEEIYRGLARLINLESVRWENLIYDSVTLKKSITEEDPYERGLRKILNFGHTIGHAVETLNLDTDHHLFHGEAIAIGMICETYLSFKKGFISKEECDQIRKDLIKLYDHHPETVVDKDALIAKMKRDKKNKSDDINFSLLKSIGHATYNQICTEEEIKEALEYYHQG